MTKEQELLYNEHFDELSGASNLEDYSEKDVDRVLNRLFMCLPNNGRFYKYRKAEGVGFDFAYDSLKNGYLWLAPASSMNDDFDTTILFDPEQDIEDVKQYLISHPIEVIQWLFKKSQESGKNLFGATPLDNELFDKAISCYNLETGKLNKNKAVKTLSKYGYSILEINKYLDEIDDLVKNKILSNKDILKQITESFLSFNQKIREMAQLFCVCERYDLDTMWAYYTDNKGFCIEYDFNNVKNLPIEKKRLFISFYKVIYNDNKGRCSFILDIKYFLGGNKDKALLAKANNEMITQLLTKQEKWKEEREWRLFVCNIENKLFADLVTAIYIDNSMIDTDNGRKLLALAKQHNWNVYIRKLNYIGTEHIYENNQN
ncbi:DUF2971 domain-containing protein [bacterium]|nr:DUF2971 domain-containing protein [bacterium]